MALEVCYRTASILNIVIHKMSFSAIQLLLVSLKQMIKNLHCYKMHVIFMLVYKFIHILSTKYLFVIFCVHFNAFVVKFPVQTSKCSKDNPLTSMTHPKGSTVTPNRLSKCLVSQHNKLTIFCYRACHQVMFFLPCQNSHRWKNSFAMHQQGKW